MVFFWQALFGLLLIEAFAFFFTVGKIGFLSTFFLWAAAAALGLWLVRKQGLSALQRLRTAPSQQVKAQDLEEGFYLLLAGLLFIFPGFVSDIVGFCLLFPATRRLAQKTQPQRTHSYHNPFQGRHDPSPGDDIVEGVYEVVEEQAAEPQRLARKP